MRKFMTLALVMVGVVALCACSDEEADKAAQEAQRVKMLEEEFQPLHKQYMAQYEKVSQAAGKIIPIRNQLRGAKKSGNENLAAELQTQLEAANGTWDSLKEELNAMEKQREDVMNKLRKLGHKFRGD